MTAARAIKTPSVAFQFLDHISHLHFTPCCKVSSIYRNPVHAVGRVQHGFGQGRVRMDGPHQVFHSGFEFHGDYGFGDQFRRLRADDVHAENLAVIGVGDDLDEALVLAHDRRARVRGEGEFSNLDVVSRFFCFGLFWHALDIVWIGVFTIVYLGAHF